MTTPSHPDRRFLVAVDMQRYSRQDNLRQYQSQRIFQEVMREAVTSLGLDRVDWILQRAGDGELAVLPPGTPEPVIVGGLVPAIDRVLRERNRSLVPEAKVRLRVALHQGLVHTDGGNGFPGEAVVEVSRLCDAHGLKRALDAFPEAAVALIVSEGIFRDVVSQRYAGLRPERFARTDVRMPDKGFATTAWIFVPDEDVNLLGLAEPPAADGTPLDPVDARPAGLAEPPGRRDGQGPGQGRRHAHSDEAEPAVSYRLDHVTASGPTVFGPGGTAIGTVNWRRDTEDEDRS